MLNISLEAGFALVLNLISCGNFTFLFYSPEGIFCQSRFERQTLKSVFFFPCGFVQMLSFLKLPLTYTMASLWELFSHLLFNLDHVSPQSPKQADCFSCPLQTPSAALYHSHLLKSRESVLGDDVAQLVFSRLYSRVCVLSQLELCEDSHA